MKPLRSILVTGASGFIGRRLCCRAREQGIEVRALVRTTLDGPWDTQVVADLTENIPKDALKGIDTVFHLAGKAHALSELGIDDMAYFDVNTDATRRLLQVAREQQVSRFVFFSSVKAMGEGDDRCLDESNTTSPETPYGRSKLAAEKLVLAQPRSLMHSVVLRLSLVYGPGSKGNLSRMLEAVDRGRFPSLSKVGNRRSMVHVEDVVTAALLAAMSPDAAGQCYIVTDGKCYSTDELYRLMREALGKPPARWSMPLPALRALAYLGDSIGLLWGRRFPLDSDAYRKLTESACYDSSKIRDGLGLQIQVDLARGLREMVDTNRATRSA